MQVASGYKYDKDNIESMDVVAEQKFIVYLSI